MRRLPAALNPTFWPVSGLTNTPLRLPGCAASSGGRPHAAGMRRSGAASRWARCVRLPLRGQHRLARLRCRQAPCFPFNCARRRSAREHQNACECRRRCGERQGETGRRGAFGTAAASCRGHSRRPRGRFARADRCAIVCAAFGARMRISAHAVKRETGGGSPPGLCCPRNGTPPARRGSPARAQAARDATALQRAGRLRSGKRPARIPADARGEPAARRTPDPRGTDGVRFPPAFARASPDPSMPCLSAGRRCAARRPLSTATTRCVPCRVR